MNVLHPGLWAVLLVVVPLLLALAGHVLGRRMQTGLTWIAPPAMLGLVAGLIGSLAAHGATVYEIGGWVPPLGIAWNIDGLAAVMLAMTSIVFAATCAYAPGYFATMSTPSNPSKLGAFWPLAYLLWAALNALFLSADVFNIYVTLELMTLASVGLIVLAGSVDSLSAAIRYLLLGLLASLLYLIGVAFIYAEYGVLDIAILGGILESNLLTWTAASLMLVGLVIKTALFPMHFWLPPAHAGAPAPVSALLSALVVKASFYLTLRLWFGVFPEITVPAVAQFLGLLGTCAILWGAIQALRAERLKGLIAYSTVAQIGYLFLLFPLATNAQASKSAWFGAILFALSHGLAKASMFMAAGRIRQVAGDDRLDTLTGIGQRTPLALSATALAGISLIGLPPSGGFAGKWMLLLSSLESNQWWWSVVIAMGGLLTAAYLFRFWSIAIAASGQNEQAMPINWRMEVPAFVLGAAAVMLIFFSTSLVELLEIGAAFPADELTEVIQ